MKRKFILMASIVGIVLIISLALILTLNKTQDSLIIIGSEYPPHEFTENGQVSGINVDFARKICSNLNIDCEIKVLPSWISALNEIKKGDANIILDAFYNEERARDLNLNTDKETETPKYFFWYDSFVFFYKTEKNYNIKSYEDVKKLNLKLGLVGEYSYSDNFWSYEFNAYSAKDPADLFENLDNGIIDILIVAQMTGDKIMEEKQLQNISSTDIIEKVYLVPFAFSNAVAETRLQKKFFKEFEKLKQEGYHLELQEKYN
ncbi:transporter substrate-binding domain-containing protein [Candidatus Pacearchaeota archaeon]|nr:transporter substrate-binding domain-containing protein [Candidatus Pacearchaeota archaeon]